MIITQLQLRDCQNSMKKKQILQKSKITRNATLNPDRLQTFRWNLRIFFFYLWILKVLEKIQWVNIQRLNQTFSERWHIYSVNFSYSKKPVKCEKDIFFLLFTKNSVICYYFSCYKECSEKKEKGTFLSRVLYDFDWSVVKYFLP